MSPATAAARSDHYAPTIKVAAALLVIAAVALLVPLPVVIGMLILLVGAMVLDGIEVARGRPTGQRGSVPPVMIRNRVTDLGVLTDGPIGRGELQQPATDWADIVGHLVTPHQRGRHVLPAVRASLVGSMGLVRWIGEVGDPVWVTVLPETSVARSSSRTTTRVTQYDDEGGRILGPLGLGTSFEALRMYLPDDDVRLINWQASERMGEPIVNQFRVELSREVIVAVDCGRTSRGVRADGVGRLDALVDAASAVARTADRVGDRCGLLAFADGPVAQLAPRVGGGVEVARRLALVDARPVAGDPRTALGALGRKRAVVVLFVDLVDSAGAAWLLDAIPVAARRHRILVVSPIDPDLTAQVAEGPHSPTMAVRAGAAASLLADAQRAAHILRRTGASVSLVPAERLTVSAVQSYLAAGSRRPVTKTAAR